MVHSTRGSVRPYEPFLSAVHLNYVQDETEYCHIPVSVSIPVYRSLTGPPYPRVHSTRGSISKTPPKTNTSPVRYIFHLRGRNVEIQLRYQCNFFNSLQDSRTNMSTKHSMNSRKVIIANPNQSPTTPHKSEKKFKIWRKKTITNHSHKISQL